MSTQIDKQKSIQRRRLTYKPTVELFLNIFFQNSIWLTLLAVPILIATNKNNNITIGGLLFLGSFCLFLLTGLYFINNLVVINGSSLNENRARIIEILKAKHPGFKIDDSGQNIITCKKNVGLTSWGKQITIIFDTDRIFINLTTFGRHGIKSPFHSISNTISIRDIKSQF